MGLQNFNTITTVRALVSWVEFMMKEMDMPLCVSTMNVCSREDYFAAIPEMAEAALEDSCTANNPRTPNYHHGGIIRLRFSVILASVFLIFALIFAAAAYVGKIHKK